MLLLLKRPSSPDLVWYIIGALGAHNIVPSLSVNWFPIAICFYFVFNIPQERQHMYDSTYVRIVFSKFCKDLRLGCLESIIHGGTSHSTIRRLNLDSDLRSRCRGQIHIYDLAVHDSIGTAHRRRSSAVAPPPRTWRFTCTKSSRILSIRTMKITSGSYRRMYLSLPGSSAILLCWSHTKES